MALRWAGGSSPLARFRAGSQGADTRGSRPDFVGVETSVSAIVGRLYQPSDKDPREAMLLSPRSFFPRVSPRPPGEVWVVRRQQDSWKVTLHRPRFKRKREAASAARHAASPRALLPSAALHKILLQSQRRSYKCPASEAGFPLQRLGPSCAGSPGRAVLCSGWFAGTPLDPVGEGGQDPGGLGFT